MIYPVDPHFPITQKFGENPAWYPTTHGHPGIDFGCPIGTPVKSVFSGQVAFAGLDPETVVKSITGYGLHVRVQGSQYFAIYGHFSAVLPACRQGDQVVEGQEIGLTGNTGFSTGPHLHFELRTSASNALTCFDPLPLLNQAQHPNRKPLFYAVVTCPSVLIRREPNRNQSPLGALSKGEVIPVYSLASQEAWIEHDRGFSAFIIGGEALMKIKDS